MNLTKTKILAVACGGAVGLAGFAESAAAQNALGDGRALDNNLSATTRFNARGPDLLAEIRFRNAIVTGNAPNGLSFRGDVGYTAPSEFRGTLGSNDLFAFRRDSIVSGLAGGGLRGTEAIQYQAALTTGGRPPQNLVGGYVQYESGAGATLGGVTRPESAQTAAQIARRDFLDTQTDTRGSLLYQLRSPATYLSNRDLNTSLVAVLPGERVTDPNRALTSSSLRGVRLNAISTGQQAAEADAEPRPGQVPAGRVESGRVETRQETEQLDRRVAPTDFSSVFDAALERTKSRMLERLTPEARENATEAEVNEAAGQLLRDLNEALRPGGLSTIAEDGEESVEGQAFNENVIELLAPDDERVREFVNADRAVGQNFYLDRMRTGERLFKEERYFDAEEAFTSALSAKPGDATAQIARAHAQIGGGLLLSAAMNLRELLAEHPVLIGQRYSGDLLPPAERIESLRALLEEYINPEPNSSLELSPALVRGSGLILAYLSFQTGDRAGLEEGLDAVEASAQAEAPNGGDTPDLRMVRLLRHVWLDEPVQGETEP